MAKLSFRVESDVSKVIELRTEIKKLEEQLKRMDGGADFNRTNANLQKMRKEYADITSKLDVMSKATKQAFTIDTSDMDKLSRAIQDADDKQRSLGRAIRDSRLEQKEIGRGEEYDKLATQILNLQREQNRYKDLLVSLKSEQKEQNRLNKEQIISEGELEKIRARGVKSIQEANDQNRKLRYSVKQIKDGDVEAIAQRRKYNEIIERNTEYIRRNSDAMTKQKMDIGGYKNAIRDAINSLKSGGNTMQNFGIIANNTSGILKNKFASGLNQVTSGVGNMVKGFVGAQAVLTGIRKFLGLLQEGVRAITDFEEANSNLQAVLRTTKEGIKDLEFDARRLGATTRYTASEVTALQIELAKLGFSREEILDSTEAVLKFAQATKSGLAESAKLAGASLRAFGADTKEVDRYVSAMAVGTTKSALSFSFLETAMSTVAPVANAFKFSIEDTVALLGSLADAGFDASSSATATRNILLNLADSNGKLAKSLGGSANTLPELVAGLNKLRNSGVDLNETLELTDKRSVAAFNTFLDGADKILELRKGVTDVQSDLDVMAETMEDNVAGAVRSLQSAWEGFMLSFSSSTGTAQKVINFFTRGIRKITQDLMSDDDLLNSRIASEQAGIRSTIQEFKVVENLSKDIKAEYDRLVEAGVSADEASLKAKESYLKKLENNSNKELALERELRSEKAKLESEPSRMQNFPTGRKTSKQRIAEIDTSLVALGGERFRTDYLMDAINSMELVEEKVEQKKIELTDKQKKELEDAHKKELALREKQANATLRLEDSLEKDRLALQADGIEKRLALIEYSYQQELKSIEKQRKESGLGADDSRVLQAIEQANAKRIASQEALYTELESKYLSYEQKVSKINAEFDADRRELEKRGNLEAIAELEKQRESAIKELTKPIKIDLDAMLGDIAKYSVDKLKRLRKELELLLKTASQDLDPTNIKTLTDALQKFDEQLLKKDAFGSLKSSLEAYKESLNDVKKATEAYERVKGDKEAEAKAEESLTVAIEKQVEARVKLGDAIKAVAGLGQEAVAMGMAFTGMLTDLGVKLPKNVNDILGGFGKAFDGLANIDITKPMSLLTSAFTIVGGLGKAIGGIGKSIVGVFRSGKRARRENREMLEILRLQNLELERQLSILRAQEELKKQSTVFGKDEWKSSKLLAENYADRNKELQETLNKLNEGEVVTGSYVSKSFWRSKRKDSWEGLLDAYPELIKESGEFDAQLAESILNTQKLDEAGTQLLTKAIEQSKELESIYEQMASHLESLFGSLGASITDNFVEAFKGGGDAMDAIYKDASKMIEDMAKQMIYSVVFGQIMQDAQEQMMAVQKDVTLTDEEKFAQLSNIMGNTLDAVEAGSEQAFDLIKWTQDEAEKRGFEIFKDSELQASRGKGFETMSQDTATELNGRFIANNELLTMIRDSLIKIEGVESEDYGLNSLMVYEDIREINSRMLVELVGINNNTGSVVEPIKSMSSNLAKLNNNIASLFD